MIVNGKEYQFPELDFNALCKLEDMGLSIVDMSEKQSLNLIRSFLALIFGSPEAAGKELSAHVINGGDLTSITDEITSAINNSGFFQALSGKTTETDSSKETTQKQAKNN